MNKNGEGGEFKVKAGLRVRIKIWGRRNRLGKKIHDETGPLRCRIFIIHPPLGKLQPDNLGEDKTSVGQDP